LHRAELEQEYGLGHVPTEAVVEALIEEASPLKLIEQTIKRVLSPMDETV
jgi:hypothetical protein